MCYKDMTFCDFYKSCANAFDCQRKLTPEVRKVARKWWGKSNPPIAIFIDKPDCYKEIDK